MAPKCPCGGFDVASDVSEQPIGIDVVTRGAKHRAAAAHVKAGSEKTTLSFGLESGLFNIGDAVFDVCVASAYDGRTHSLGLSCAFEIPTAILRHVMDDGMDLSQASNAAGWATDSALGSKGGLIAILTRNRITRTDYTVQAVKMALAPRESQLPGRSP